MAVTQKNVFEKDGEYFSQNPESRNIAKLEGSEVYDYLFNKKTLTPKEIEKVLGQLYVDGKPSPGKLNEVYNAPRGSLDTNRWLAPKNISDREIAHFISGGHARGEVDRRVYDNIPTSEVDPLYAKAVVDLAYHRGATSTDMGPTAEGIDIPPHGEGEGLTGSDTYVPLETMYRGKDPIKYQEAVDELRAQGLTKLSEGGYKYGDFATRSTEYPFDYTRNLVSEEKVLNDFERFSADQNLKTQKIVNDYYKTEANDVFDYGETAANIENLDSTFANIKPEFLERMHNVAKSDSNYSGLNSADDVINAMTKMVNEDKPLGESNYPTSLEILDGIIVDNLKNVSHTINAIGTSKAIRDVVNPITKQMKKFAGGMVNTIGNVPNQLASVMAAQDPVTNEIPGGIVGSEAFEETFQNTYGDMPELKELDE